MKHTKEWWREYRAKNADKLREYKRSYDRKRYITHNASENARRIKWRQNNPEKVKAQSMLNSAISSGAIERKPCQICGGLIVHGHHEDYSKPLEVIWLCPSHHATYRKPS